MVKIVFSITDMRPPQMDELPLFTLLVQFTLIGEDYSAKDWGGIWCNTEVIFTLDAFVH